MTCDDIRDLIEPWAAGEASPSTEAAAHLRACASCQEAFAFAMEIERALADADSVAIPSRFTDRIVREARRERSINREFSDAIFHAATTGALVIAGVAVWISLAGSGVDLSELPIAPISLAAATAWLAWLWSGDRMLTQR
jgi:predicted anti-sigma-YlaC factor YlaD